MANVTVTVHPNGTTPITVTPLGGPCLTGVMTSQGSKVENDSITITDVEAAQLKTIGRAV